jgi:hypothetical protein
MERIFEQILNQSMIESGRKNSRLNEALTQKQKKDVLSYIKEHSFFPLTGGNYSYFIVPVDDEHIEMTLEFKEQLENEGYYGRYYVSGIMSSSVAKLPIGMKWLPIYGNSNRFDTKWFSRSYDDCFAKDLKDRMMKLSKRLDIDEIM